MDILKLIPDRYTLHARAMPVLWALAPIFIVYFGLYSSFNLTALRDFGVGAILLVIACHLVRDMGTGLEKKLLKKWGQLPSVKMLRWNDDALSDVYKESLRKAFASLIPDLIWPTKRQESANPAKADQAYQRVCLWLRSKTRNHDTFNVLHHENIRYGYQRNLLALRALGIALASLCLFGVVFKISAAITTELLFSTVPARDWAVCGTLSLYIWLLLRSANHRLLKNSARGYAKELLACADHLRP